MRSVGEDSGLAMCAEKGPSLMVASRMISNPPPVARVEAKYDHRSMCI